ncbi:PREDICTED: melanoma-associated antigen B5-like [Chinchilla lanigera]|uniref:melanoma-associated antigen B5-like n=1 Tax=Chinchilla lanigera TaxID=34839 RepID=UPI00038EE7E2|nr:PREDICTED: melanoma-associated antigen B5-like [Chinchilla lanigera]
MPRGHNSKCRAHHKCPQAGGDSKVCDVAQEAVLSRPEAEALKAEAEKGAGAAAVGEEKEEEEESSFSQDPPGAASCIPSLSQKRTPSITGLSEDGTSVTSEVVSNFAYEENISEASFYSECLLDPPTSPVERLEWSMLHKFHLRKFFTRAELLTDLTPRSRHEFPEIFKSACAHLEAVFAVEVVEVESARHSYNLFSTLNLPNNGRIRSGRGYPKTGLLMKVLAVIVMKDHRAAEEDIWKFLRKLQVYPGKKHIMFGEPKKLLTQDFVRLNYLVYQQVPGSDPPRHEFLWGPEARAESNKEKILKYFKRINKIAPTYFSNLFEDAGKEENERFQKFFCAKPRSTNPRAVARAKCRVASSKPFDV